MMSGTPRVFVGTTTLQVTDALCEHCLDAAVAATERVPGVRSAVADRVTGMVTVRATGPVDLADVVLAVASVGHTCTSVR